MIPCNFLITKDRFLKHAIPSISQTSLIYFFLVKLDLL